MTTEQYDRLRGKLNVEEPLLTRVENIKKTGLADEIIIEDHPGQKEEDVVKYGIDIFTVGSDWTGAFDYLKGKCEVVYLERTKDISSTMLREKLHPIIRLGVVGTGRIANRFVAETKFVSGIESKSVYNPHKENAIKFSLRFGLRAHYEEYEKFWMKSMRYMWHHPMSFIMNIRRRHCFRGNMCCVKSLWCFPAHRRRNYMGSQSKRA